MLLSKIFVFSWAMVLAGAHPVAPKGTPGVANASVTDLAARQPREKLATLGYRTCSAVSQTAPELTPCFNL